MPPRRRSSRELQGWSTGYSDDHQVPGSCAAVNLAAAGAPSQGSRREPSVEKIDLDMDQGWPTDGSADWPDVEPSEQEENEQ